MTGLELRELRLSRGLTQEAVAEILGVGRSSVASYERSWIRIPTSRAEAAKAIRSMRPRRCPRLDAHAQAQAVRAGIHRLTRKVCSRCGRQAWTPPSWVTCGHLRCLRTLGPQVAGLRTPVSDTRLAAIVDLMLGEPRDTVSERYGYRAASIPGILWQAGVRMGRIEVRRRPRRARDRDIAERYVRGEPLEEIARAHGVSRERVRQILEPMGASGQARRLAAAQNHRHRAYVRRHRNGSPAYWRSLRGHLRRAEGEALGDARIACGLTQRELGARLGARDQGTVSAWETGRWNLTRAARDWLYEQLSRMRA